MMSSPEFFAVQPAAVTLIKAIAAKREREEDIDWPFKPLKPIPSGTTDAV